MTSNFKYAPGLPGYGTVGKDGSSGLPGLGTYFTSFDGVLSQAQITARIEANQVLFASGEPLPGFPERVYQTGDIIIDVAGAVYEIDLDLPNKFAAIGSSLSSEAFFGSQGPTSTTGYTRFANDFTTDKQLVDSVYSNDNAPGYKTTPGTLYVDTANDFPATQFSNVNLIATSGKSYFPFMYFTDGDADEEAIAIVMETASKDWRIGNRDENDVQRSIDLKMDFSTVHVPDGSIISLGFEGPLDGSINLIRETANAGFPLVMSASDSGFNNMRSNSGIRYNPNTDTLIVGNITATVAGAASQIAMGASGDGDTTMYPVLVANNTATDQEPKYDNGLIYNSNTNTLTATTFAGNLSGTVSTATQNSITTMTGLTTVGTIGTGVWEGTDVAVAHGGTGVSTLTNGGIMLGSGTSAVTVTAQPTSGQLLIGVTGGDPILATLTEGAGIDITNGAGSITIAGETATTSNAGIVELATGAEVATGTDADRAITPSTTSSIAAVGTLNSGSISTGFGNIDNGTSNITTGGIFKIDVDGTDVNAAGSITVGASNDGGMFYDGGNNRLYIRTQAAGAGDIYLDAEGDNVVIQASGVTTATFGTNGLNLVSGDAYEINGTDVLTATTLGSGVTSSSLTSVGALNSGSISTGFGNIDNGTSNITTGGRVILDVDGTAYNAAGAITFGSGGDCGIFYDTAFASSTDAMVLQTSASTKDIKFAVGSTIEFTFDMGTGDATADDWIATSDERLKENFVSYGPVLDRITSLKGKFSHFDWIDKDKKDVGYGAQTMRGVFPEIVKGQETDEEHLSISYAKLGGIALEGIAEERAIREAEIQELREENQDLRTRLEKLEEIVSKL